MARKAAGSSARWIADLSAKLEPQLATLTTAVPMTCDWAYEKYLERVDIRMRSNVRSDAAATGQFGGGEAVRSSSGSGVSLENVAYCTSTPATRLWAKKIRAAA